MTNEVIVTLIGVFSSILISIYSVWTSRKSQREIELLKYKLEEEKHVKNAQIDYEYETRKRLYSSYQPLLFQLTELSENIKSRIEGMAKNGKEGKLENTEWINFDNYYFQTTVYLLFAPLGLFKIIQKNISIVDFGVDSHISLNYKFVKIAINLLQDDFRLARHQDFLEGQQYLKKWQKEHTIMNESFDRQGLPPVKIDSIGSHFIINENSQWRLITLSEFEEKVKEKEYREKLLPIMELFSDFSPNKKPVLMMIFIGQACLFHIISKYKNDKEGFNIDYINKEIEQFFNSQSDDYSWTADANDKTNIKKFELIKAHLKKQINSKFNI